MSEISNEGVQAQIKARGLYAGNRVLNASDAVVTAEANLRTNANSELEAVVPLTAVQNTDGGALLDLTGTTGATLTSTFIESATVTTFTNVAYARINIVDDAGTLTDGGYYVLVGTIT